VIGVIYPMTMTPTEAQPTADVRVVRATVQDAEGIARLVNYWAAQGQMLPRTLGETYENLRDFFVVRADDGHVVACGALHIVWADMAELKSLAVEESEHSRGLGAAITRACVEEGRALGLKGLFALTYRPGFFERLGWRQADVMTLPRKVWNECYRCPKFPGCDEIAMVIDLVPGGIGTPAPAEARS
jgi:amino-acid N-acetyltransferase